VGVALSTTSVINPTNASRKMLRCRWVCRSNAKKIARTASLPPA
jgi:hypothetical protein